jgi:outer membrane protein assembly factor BamB
MNCFRRMAVVGLLAGALGGSLPAGADWPQFQGPDRNGHSPETGLLRSWPETGPRELWTVPLGSGYSSAAVMGGDVYVLDRENDETDILRCFSLADGKEQWTHSYAAPGDAARPGSRTPPTVDAKYVYSVGMMGHFLCIDRATHKPVWQKDLMAEFGAAVPQWGFSQSPLLYKNLVIVAPQAPEAFAVAFDRETGALVWKSPGLGLPGYVSPLVTTLAGVEQLVVTSASDRDGGAKGCTTGLSLADGSVLWKYEGWQCFIPIAHATPLGDDKLFITAGYDAGSAIIQIAKSGDALAATEVKKISAEVCGSQIQQPVFVGGHLYIGNNSNERELGLTCMTVDGEVKWRTSDDETLPNFERGPFLAVDGLLIGLDGKDGTLHLIDPSPDGYKELTQAKVLVGRELWAPLALSDGKLLLRSHKLMKCLDLKNP